MKRVVRRDLARRKDETIRHIGMDKKSFIKGHSYVSFITDIDGKRVLDVDCRPQKRGCERIELNLRPFYWPCMGGGERNC